MKKQEEEDLTPYKKYGLTLLQLMGLLLVVGIAVELILRLFFHK
jgi:hypothetical protein